MPSRFDDVPLDGRPPVRKAPPGSVDTHIHFFDGRFPGQPGGPPPLGDATPADYRVVQNRLGLDKMVIIQSAAYQFDNRCQLEALKEFGDDARAIVCLTGSESEATLQDWHDLGVRGVRIMDLPGGASDLTDLPALAHKVRPFGWHPIVQFDGRRLPDVTATLQALEGDYIIDHTGKFLEPVSPDDPAFEELLRLVDRGNCYVKVSAYYETSRTGAPDYEDIGALARALINHAPDRILWATNWPHVGRTAETYPDDADMLDRIVDWAGSEEILHRILVDNPARLYGF